MFTTCLLAVWVVTHTYTYFVQIIRRNEQDCAIVGDLFLVSCVLNVCLKPEILKLASSTNSKNLIVFKLIHHRVARLLLLLLLSVSTRKTSPHVCMCDVFSRAVLKTSILLKLIVGRMKGPSCPFMGDKCIWKTIPSFGIWMVVHFWSFAESLIDTLDVFPIGSRPKHRHNGRQTNKQALKAKYRVAINFIAARESSLKSKGGFILLSRDSKYSMYLFTFGRFRLPPMTPLALVFFLLERYTPFHLKLIELSASDRPLNDYMFLWSMSPNLILD